MTTMILVLVVMWVLLLVLMGRLLICLSRPPHFVIGKPGSPYMNRWFVLPRNRLFNIYLHQVLRSDDDRALHDHPWINLSIVLKGGYREVMPHLPPSPLLPVPTTETRWRGPGSIVLRRPTAAHRLEVDPGAVCWSLFVTGPNVRTWGFWCPGGWKPWQEFVDMTDTGAIGPGCGEGR